MKAKVANPYQRAGSTSTRCPQCGTISSEPARPGRTTCHQCGFRYCPECHYYRHSLRSDFCLACGVQLNQTSERRVPLLPSYLDQHVARSISLINLWFLAWLALTLGGGPIWIFAIICSSLALYWFTHFWRFRQRTGLVYASRFIGGIGLAVFLTMTSLVLLQIWLIRPPVHWQSIDLWAFILFAMIILPLGVLAPPVVMQSKIGTKIADEATLYAARWTILERMRYRDMLFLRIPDVRHLPAVSHPIRMQ